MKIEDVIVDFDDAAKDLKRKGFNANSAANASTPYGKECYKLAAVNQQVADWLRELVALRAQTAGCNRSCTEKVW